MLHMMNRKKGLALAGVLAASVAITGCSDSDNDDAEAEVRVIHASPDAPAVNIKLDGVTAIDNLDYANSSGFAVIEADMIDVTVEGIVPGGNIDVIEVEDLDFAEDSQTTIMAVGNVADIEPLVVSDSTTDPTETEVAVSVVHASPDAGAVDVYVTASGVDVNTVDATLSFEFKESVDAGALAGGVYRIQVTGAGSKTVVYDSGDVDLTPFAGEKLLIAAINTVNDTTQAAAPVKLLVMTGSASIELLDSATQIGARVAHGSPNADAAAGGDVEVWASADGGAAVELIPGFSYTETVPTAAAGGYVNVDAADYIFDVSVDGAGPGTLYTSDALTLEAGMEYSVIASGLVAGNPAFDLLATADHNRAVATQASVKVIHAAPAAGLVDVYVTAAGAFTAAEVEMGMAGDPLLENFDFADITDYVAVAPGDYDVRVVAGGSTAIDETYTLGAGAVVSVIALQANSNGGAPTDFSYLVLSN